MDASFWQKKWQTNDIAFHNPTAHPLLVQYFEELSLEPGGRVFLPLCGKTLDIAWLLDNGYRVAGAELSKTAIEQLFSELGLEPTINTIDELIHYSANHIDIFVGDIFDLSKATLGEVDAIYDRAALVALPQTMRQRYTEHLMEITNKAPQLLIIFEYDQNLLAGPPFSISNEELSHHYRHRYQFALLASNDVVGGLKGKCVAKEKIWLLDPC
ncbi:thiopurine S-methyltransferase [Neisseriaceae bacterium TC5R-5]|nr:thiopurine S-methyltransferase [Neisseriaceae bacterium TC5R-5]